jgi:hypothetical protein
METDLLKASANAFKKLTSVAYHIVLGRKGKTYTLDIVFMPDNFYHLAGFHKLKQRYSFQQHTSAWVLDHIIDGTITADDISGDQNFNIIADRLYALAIFEQIIDSSDTKFYAYDMRKVSFATRINADYLVKGSLKNEPVIFSFFVGDQQKYYMNSIFPETRYDYSFRQTQYTVLLKEKTIAFNSSAIELYRHNKYSVKPPQQPTE